jgi:RAC serine/threonine-protein kinase
MEDETVSIEGWLHKRGEHIKTWRPRYFILKRDGRFLGYNNRPLDKSEADQPNNIFFIKDCKISKCDKPKSNVFVIKCHSYEMTVIERFLATSNAAERQSWIEAIEKVSNSLNGSFTVNKPLSLDKHQIVYIIKILV